MSVKFEVTSQQRNYFTVAVFTVRVLERWTAGWNWLEVPAPDRLERSPPWPPAVLERTTHQFALKLHVALHDFDPVFFTALTQSRTVRPSKFNTKIQPKYSHHSNTRNFI